MDWDINTKFSPVVNLYENPLCTENQGHRCSKFGFIAKNVTNFPWKWWVQFLSYTLQIWWEIIFSIVVKVVKVWLGYLKWFWIWQDQCGVSCPFLQTSLHKFTFHRGNSNLHFKHRNRAINSSCNGSWFNFNQEPNSRQKLRIVNPHFTYRGRAINSCSRLQSALE